MRQPPSAVVEKLNGKSSLMSGDMPLKSDFNAGMGREK